MREYTPSLRLCSGLFFHGYLALAVEKEKEN